jgi:hypothetical protein
MATVKELAALYGNFMVRPQPGPGVCDVCFNLTDGFERCYACAHGELWLEALCPVSYSVAREQLHHALKGYKRLAGNVGRRLSLELAAVLWRHVESHERCLARAAGVDRFELVTTVPSGDRDRDEHHPLRWMVGELVGPTRGRHQRLLRRSTVELAPRAFDPGKYEPVRRLSGQAVLLIDDTSILFRGTKSEFCSRTGYVPSGCFRPVITADGSVCVSRAET